MFQADSSLNTWHKKFPEVRIWETLLGLRNSMRMCFYYATLRNVAIIILYYWIFFSIHSTEEDDNFIYRYAK